MEHQFVESGIAAAVIEEDETDDHAVVRKRFNLAIEGFEKAGVGLQFTGLGEIEELGEIDIESGVFDAEREGIIDHLNLEPFLGGWVGERGGILGMSGHEEKSDTEDGEQGHGGGREARERFFINVQRRANA